MEFTYTLAPDQVANRDELMSFGRDLRKLIDKTLVVIDELQIHRMAVIKTHDAIPAVNDAA